MQNKNPNSWMQNKIKTVWCAIFFFFFFILLLLLIQSPILWSFPYFSIDFSHAHQIQTHKKTARGLINGLMYFRCTLAATIANYNEFLSSFSYSTNNYKLIVISFIATAIAANHNYYASVWVKLTKLNKD